MEPSGSAGDQCRPHGRWLRDRLQTTASVCRQRRRSQPTSVGAIESSVLALAIALPSKLRVAPAETEHMPIYLRTFFRVLSSWVHACVVVFWVILDVPRSPDP